MTDFKREQVRDDYDRIAHDYAENIARELEGKPFDRDLLRRFVGLVPAGGEICEIGCGPGHVARFLHDAGANVFGIDLSQAMVDEAKRLHPQMKFVQGDVFALPLARASLDGIVAFYAIVNLPPESLEAALREMRRVVKPGGWLLLAFHVGDEVVRPGAMWGKAVSLDFYFLEPKFVSERLASAGWSVTEATERDPYAPEVEHQSRRAYILAQAV